jgi:hypothetical protein
MVLLKHDEPVSSFALSFNLRRYNADFSAALAEALPRFICPAAKAGRCELKPFETVSTAPDFLA